jgi:mono/diheme cytochrome c family protein
MTRYGLVLLLLVGGCDDDVAPPTDGGMDQSVGDMTSGGGGDGGGPTAARGEYLVKHLLMCGDCHSTPDNMGQPDPNKFLAGGRTFAVPGFGPDGGVGLVYSKNLTNDATGLANWTESQIVDALTVGVDDQGEPLWPIMPYYMFGNMTMDDAQSIAMYIKSVPGISNNVPENTASTPPGATPKLDDTAIPHTTLAMSDSNYASAERGRYLAKIACIECHTPRTPPGPPPPIDLSKAFSGSVLFPLGPITTISANITPDATGLSGWTTQQISDTLKTGQEKGTGRMLCPPMPAGPGRLGGLTDGDLSDIANFVHTLPAVVNGPFGCDDAGVPYHLDGGT